MPSNLPPLDFKEDVERYEAFSEKKEIDFKKCSHKQNKIINGVLKCSCGAGWRDSLSNLIELQKLLSRQET